MMDLAVLHTLEYDKIREMLAARVSSTLGRELVETLVPESRFDIIRELLDETQEAYHILSSMSNVPLGGLRDVRDLLKRTSLGGSLEPHELLQVASTLYASRRMKSFFADLRDVAPRLTEVSTEITILRTIEIAIENTITDEGGVRDDASSELAKIRREIRLGQHRVKEKLDGILRSPEYQKYFQDALVTMRGDRYVIPIKQEYRQCFPGIVHDQSASGATIFIEPMAVVHLNNDIKQAMAAEKNEVERILQELCAKIEQVAPAALINCDILAKLDFVFAKARLGLDMRAIRPELNSQGQVKLLQARHPLIPADKVVPIDIYLGDEFRILLVTGPNTGGKTVSLKTLGLFVLMTQSGLFIPAAPGAEMAIFRKVYADIGDEQSIEQSLSTFSAHMTHLVKILEDVSGDDLVLIDEIGAGTDPEEGAALAIAILENLLNSGVSTVATTHYSELKGFAFSRSGVQNASVEFDVETLKPTYRLIIGVPGSSNAFAISKRLGLNDNIIDRAKEMIGSEHAQLERMLNSLEGQKKLYERLNSETTIREKELLSRQQKLDQDVLAFQEKKQSILATAKEEASQILRTARRESQDIISELKQLSNQSERERQKGIKATQQRLSAQLSEVNQRETDDDKRPPVQVEKLIPGTKVYVSTLRQTGTILVVNGQQANIQLGIMKMNVPLSDCRLAEGDAANKPEKQKRTTVDLANASSVSREIDIRGLMVEEAEIVLGKYIDDALLAGLNEITVIHGKGTGALRSGVRSFLKSHYNVRDISIGEYNAGGNGATVVKLN